jgi:hypothetical protein
MFYVATMPMPGALRLRALHPLVEGDGSCNLVYDLERAAVLEVPEDLQLHIAVALETGDLDEHLMGWLMSEDLLTGEGEVGWAGIAEGAGQAEQACGRGVGSLYRIDGELHVRIDGARAEEALEIIGCVLQQSAEGGRVKLHLDWGGTFPGCLTLERILAEAFLQAARLRQEIAFELTLGAEEVTPAVADLLTGSPLRVKLLCGGYPSPAAGFYSDRRSPAWSAEQAVILLANRLGERLTVHCVLGNGCILDVWDWAKQSGVRHLDATILTDAEVGDGQERLGWLKAIHNDLITVSEEMAEALATQRLPVDFKPLTRIVGRLMRSEALDGAYSEQGSFGGVVPVADVYPRALLDGMDLRSAPDPWGGGEDDLEAQEGNAGFSCHCCWARHACCHSSYAATFQDGEDLREPAASHCALWRVEVEAALRFYHRLAHTDPMQVRRFFEDSSAPGPDLERHDDLGHLRMPF